MKIIHRLNRYLYNTKKQLSPKNILSMLVEN